MVSVVVALLSRISNDCHVLHESSDVRNYKCIMEAARSPLSSFVSCTHHINAGVTYGVAGSVSSGPHARACGCAMPQGLSVRLSVCLVLTQVDFKV